MNQKTSTEGKRFSTLPRVFWHSIALLAFVSARPALPCTTFVLHAKNSLLFGKNLDWFWEDGLVIVNQRNLQKTSVVMPPSSPAQWVSKYGSVSFNQFGRDLPFGGMNEAGLVVENMWLNEAEFPAADSRPAINLLQWIQYQLDNCRTVKEVLATDGKIRIEPPPASAKDLGRVHYLICDAAGEAATIEFIGGKLVCHRDQEMPLHALANDTYQNSVAYALSHPGQHEAKGPLADRSSFARFSRAAARASEFTPRSARQNIQYAFDTLDQVCQPGFTVWSIVYDLAGRKITYRSRSNQEERVLDLKKINFSCPGPVQFVDIAGKPGMDGKPEFLELSGDRLRQYMEGFYSRDDFKSKLGDLSPLMYRALQVIGAYKCNEIPGAAATAGH